ncbi:MAG: 6-phosphofructokinase [Candidatus Eisenbacteria bacterium]
MGSADGGVMRPFRILVVDPDLEVQFRLCRELQRRDYEVRCSADGEEALGEIRRTTPDIVLCDESVEGVSAFDICSRLKSSPESADIFFLVAGAGGDGERDALARGADGYLGKPVVPAVLAAFLQVAERRLLRSRGPELQRRQMYREMDVLVVQDGGCAPGYNPVTAFLTDELERRGRRVYAAREGFRSLVSGGDGDFARLVYDQREHRRIENVPGVFNAAFLNDSAGAQFRSERYREFEDPENQMRAVKNLLGRGVRALVGVGGNGTLMGVRELASRLPSHVRCAFVPVTVDSDVSGTECIGQHTGVEYGADKLRRYMADARTHKRVYVVEFMGARGGFHALYSCLGARAHMAVLPSSKPDFGTVMEELNRRDYGVIAVAEGFAADDPSRKERGENAAEHFVRLLRETGIESNKKIVAEPFSRSLRGALPNNQDIALARRMAWGVAEGLGEGRGPFMPAVLAEKLSFIPFAEIRTENAVSRELTRLADRLTPRGGGTGAGSAVPAESAPAPSAV